MNSFILKAFVTAAALAGWIWIEWYVPATGGNWVQVTIVDKGKTGNFHCDSWWAGSNDRCYWVKTDKGHVPVMRAMSEYRSGLTPEAFDSLEVGRVYMVRVIGGSLLATIHEIRDP